MSAKSPRPRLGPSDEALHENTGESNFNESVYLNFYDPGPRVGGFLRIGNRPNEGFAETTLCLYRPDGGVVFNYKRPPIEDNARFDAGGFRFEVEEPFETLRVAYRGKACALAEPMAMSDPRTAFAENPFVEVELDLHVRAVGPVFGGVREPAEGTDPESEFARGHYEQHHRATGRLRIDGERFDVSGHGLRDHSWGPRSWQAPRFYRWLTGSFGDDLGFMANRIALPGGREVRGGFLHRGRELVRVRDAEIETEWREPAGVHERVRARLACDDGRWLEIRGRVLSLIPLRNRRGGRTTRIAEGLTEWSCEGRRGYGLAEYLDQVE